MTISWHFRQFNELSLDELYAILALRQEVFVIEQKCSYIDLDYLDQKATHLACHLGHQLATYMRLLPPGTVYPDSFCIGRVVTAPFARQKGLAKIAMQKAIEYFESIDKDMSIRLSAQSYLVAFYESFGFRTEGELYDDAGVEHIDMVRYNR